MKNQKKISISVVISIIAILISFLSIYISRFEVNHDLYFAYSINKTIDGIIDSLIVDPRANKKEYLVFYNKGNQDEVIINVYVTFALDDPYDVPIGILPFVVPSKKAIIIDIPTNLYDNVITAIKLSNKQGFDFKPMEVEEYGLKIKYIDIKGNINYHFMNFDKSSEENNPRWRLIKLI